LIVLGLLRFRATRFEFRLSNVASALRSFERCPSSRDGIIGELALSVKFQIALSHVEAEAISAANGGERVPKAVDGSGPSLFVLTLRTRRHQHRDQRMASIPQKNLSSSDGNSPINSA
jgi:hypothetical protein